MGHVTYGIRHGCISKLHISKNDVMGSYLHHTVCCLTQNNAVHKNFQGNENNTTTLDVFVSNLLHLHAKTSQASSTKADLAKVTTTLFPSPP